MSSTEVLPAPPSATEQITAFVRAIGQGLYRGFFPVRIGAGSVSRECFWRISDLPEAKRWNVFPDAVLAALLYDPTYQIRVGTVACSGVRPYEPLATRTVVVEIPVKTEWDGKQYVSETAAAREKLKGLPAPSFSVFSGSLIAGWFLPEVTEDIARVAAIQESLALHVGGGGLIREQVNRGSYVAGSPKDDSVWEELLASDPRRLVVPLPASLSLEPRPRGEEIRVAYEVFEPGRTVTLAELERKVSK